MERKRREGGREESNYRVCNVWESPLNSNLVLLGFLPWKQVQFLVYAPGFFVCMCTQVFVHSL
jgi:hypothetical protein